MPLVYIPPTLRALTGGQETVQVAGETVLQVLESVDQLYPGFQERVCQGTSLRPGLAVVIDGSVNTLGTFRRVEPHAELHILPALGGG